MQLSKTRSFSFLVLPSSLMLLTAPIFTTSVEERQSEGPQEATERTMKVRFHVCSLGGIFTARVAIASALPSGVCVPSCRPLF